MQIIRDMFPRIDYKTDVTISGRSYKGHYLFHGWNTNQYQVTGTRNDR